MAAGAPNERIRCNAFSATPKAKTLDLFGRPANPALPPSADSKPEAFHLYSMRQAVEEGFILDVLQTYPTYSTVWKIAHLEGDAEEGDSKKARMKLARWGRLHPYSVSRQEAVRYQLTVKGSGQGNSGGNLRPS